ncbi:glycosyltransferase [Mucilaginibacter yixingensis]|nr:glycosyltransferase [Mucilaginibacter yixingensis]
MQQWWTCLFPGQSANELIEGDIKTAVLRALDHIKPDVIIAPSIVFFAGALGMQWAKNNGCKFIMFDDAKSAQVKRNVVVQWIKDTIIAQADALWLPSAFYDADYTRFLNKGVQLFYGFSSIDNAYFTSKSSYQASADSIICVARLVPIKNIDGLLKAWQLVEQGNSKLSITIIGDGSEMVLLKQLAIRLDLKRVTFTGAVSNVDLPAYFSNAAAFILPSLSETWGLVVNEAMAAGLPVLLSLNVNAAQSLLQEGVNGFGFEPTDINSIYNAVLNFDRLDRVERLAMSAASLKLVNAMSYQAMGDQLLTALNGINSNKFKKAGWLAAAIIKRWNGRNNTAGWNVLQG